MRSSVVLLNEATLSFVINQLFEKWYQYIPKVWVRVHGFVVKYSTDDSPSTYSTPHSKLYVIYQNELSGDFRHSRFMCSENLHNRLRESMLRRL
jgi:hypothetical protein